jgi:tetratricopeptide (TPR) repeat protein
MGALALARHHFQAALDWGGRAVAINPSRPYAYGVIADAQVELGQYEAAVTTLQKMVDLRPDMSSFTRISYLRELHGDKKGALEIMQRAVDSGVPHDETTAWARTQLGNLYLNSGDLDQAEIEYQRTLLDYPGYVYALAGLGRVRAARWQTEEAISYLSEAIETVPLPEFVILLADVYEVSGQTDAAIDQHELLGTIQTLYESEGVDMDLEIAIFNADHDIDLETNLTKARQAFERRPGVHAADGLAWTFYKSGMYEEARTYSDQALRLGSQDALMLFHSGMIHYRLGNRDLALEDLEQALAINPHFSIRYSGEARRILEELKSISTKR